MAEQLCLLCGQATHKDEEAKPYFLAAHGAVVFRGRSAKLTPMQLDLFAVLLEAHPAPVSRARILADLYEDRDNDEKLPNPKILDVATSQIRKAFREGGVEITIVARRGWGDRSGYALSF